MTVVTMTVCTYRYTFLISFQSALFQQSPGIQQIAIIHNLTFQCIKDAFNLLYKHLLYYQYVFNGQVYPHLATRGAKAKKMMLTGHGQDMIGQRKKNSKGRLNKHKHLHIYLNTFHSIQRTKLNLSFILTVMTGLQQLVV